jgi:parallel beta helix pectate lyase-like protein
MNAKQQITVAVVTVLLVAVVALVSWSQRATHPGAGPAAEELSVSVTSPDDMGPGSLREALYIAASAKGRASVRIVARKVTLKTALPPLMNPHGMRLLAQPAGAEIDAQALAGGAVLDVVGPNTSVEGVVVRNCPGAAVLLRAAHFRLHASVIESCDVGVEVAASAADILLDDNRFANDSIGVRFAAPNPDTAVVGNTFVQAKAAGLWAVRGDPGVADSAIRIRDNHFTDNHSGVVAGNIPIVVEHNEFTGNAPDAAVHLVGAGAVIRNNRIHGRAAMGIVAENAREALIEGNELDGLSSYAIMLRSSASAMVRANRVSACASGMAFVLGDPGHPSSAIGNTIADPRLDGIDVISDSPILKDNQVLRPHALALRVTDYAQAVGASVRAQPSLQGNNFRANTIGTLPAAEHTSAAVSKP